MVRKTEALRVLFGTQKFYRFNAKGAIMRFLVRLFLACFLIQTHGFCASKISVLEPLVTTSLRRVHLSAMKPNILSAYSFPVFQPYSSPRIPSKCFAVPKRFFSDESKTNAVKIGNPCIDGIFQYGFESSMALKGFLNAVLGFEGEKSIQNIEYLRRDMPPSDPSSPLGYHFTVDVRCRTKEGQHFLVEMQNDFRDDYHMKSLIEHSRMLSRLDIGQNMEEQEQRSEKSKKDTKKFWKGIQGLYAVVITNKSFSRSSMKSSYPGEPMMEPFLVNSYELRHTKQLERRYGDIPNQIVLFMLDNLKKSVTELSTPVERWAYLFKDSSMRSGVTKISETKEIEDPEAIAGEDQAIREFIDRVNIKHLPYEVRERYINAISYYNGCILDIQEKAEERGRKEVAKNLLKGGMKPEDVAINTNLSEEQVGELLG